MALVISGCEKVGPQGPPGPEGPPGNNGTDGSGESTVVAYTTENSGIERFFWQESDASNEAAAIYRLVAVQDGSEYTGIRFTDTTGTADDAIFLVYLRLILGGEAETWVGLPHYDGATVGVDKYSVEDIHIEPSQEGGRTSHEVSIGINVTRFVDPRYGIWPPRHQPYAVRVVVIPKGSVGRLGAVPAAKLHTLLP